MIEGGDDHSAQCLSNEDHREDDYSDEVGEVDDFFGHQDEYYSDGTDAGDGGGEGPRGRGVHGGKDKGGMAGREMRAEGERLRNLGYHEAYDRCKELRLQEGFEVGYAEAYDISFEVGKKLGLVTTRAALLAAEAKKSNSIRDGTNQESERVGDGEDDSVKNLLGPQCPRDTTEISASASRAASIVREFVDVVTAAGDGRNVDGDGDGGGGDDGRASLTEGGGFSDRGDDSDVANDGGGGLDSSSSASFAAAAEDVMRRMDEVSI